jgi:hypothetical protein
MRLSAGGGSSRREYESSETKYETLDSERTEIMILGMTTSTFTLVHVVISFIGIGSGFVVIFGLVAGNGSTVGRRSFWRPRWRRV